jgi:hypothetical protein
LILLRLTGGVQADNLASGHASRGSVGQAQFC